MIFNQKIRCTMKSKLVILLVLFSTSIFAQDFFQGTIITQRYDTISNVKIKKISEGRSLLHISYIDNKGNTQNPAINTIKSYSRGEDNFIRIFHNGEMILVKQVVKGTNLNLYARRINGGDTYFIEKVFDELIKVPSMKGKFRKVIGNFLSDYPTVSAQIKEKKLTDIEEIVHICNKGETL